MKTIFFLIFFTILNIAYGQVEMSEDAIKKMASEVDPLYELSKSELNILKQELKVQTLILETVKELELEGVEFKNLQKAENSIQEVIHNSVRMKAIDVGFRFEQKTSELIRDSLHDSNLKSKFNKIKKFVVNDFYVRKNQAVAIARRNGIQVAIFYLAAAQVDYTMPAIIALTGNPALGGALYATPFSSTSTGTFIFLKQLIKQRHVRKQLGIKVYNQWKSTLKQVKTFLGRNFFKSDYLQYITVNKNLYSFTFEETKGLSKILTKMGFNEKALNWENLSHFLRQEDRLINSLDKLENSKSPKISKILAVLQEIESSGDIELINKLQMRFNNKINQFAGVIHNTDHLKWFVRVANSQNFDHFFRLMRNMPEDIPARVFGKIWQQYVLPGLDRSVHGEKTISSYKAFRKLHDIYDTQIKASFIANQELDMRGAIKAKFVNYLFDATTLYACGQIFKKVKNGTTPLL